MAFRDFKSKLGRIIAQQAGTMKGELEARIRVEVEKYIQQLLQECPPPAVLNNISGIVNNLSLTVNQFERRVDKWNQTARSLQPAILAADIVIQLLKKDPLPVATGITPSPGAPFISLQRMSRVSRRASTIRKLERFVSALAEDRENIQKVTESVLVSLSPISAKIERLRALIERCATGKEETIKAIQPAQPAEITEQYRSTNGKDYQIFIRQVPTETDIAPRRQAIAKDFRGIIVLSGPASFSSSTQVLIDELKFKIDNQLL